MDKHLLEARDNIIEAAGRTTQGFGLGRIIGQLYALLFFSPRPMSLDEMAEELKVSKGSVSTNIRELEKWSAVRRVWVKGDRKDYYEAEVEYIKILKNGILPFIRRKIGSASMATLESRDLLKNNHKKLPPEDIGLEEFYRKRLDLMEKAQSQLSMLLQLQGILNLRTE